MKKNYLVAAILSALVLSGCNNDSSSSKVSNTTTNSSTSSIVVNTAKSTVKEAVSTVDTNYTVIYKLGGTGTSYSNKYQDEYYYSDYLGAGYYFKDDTVFYIQVDTNGAPFYSSYGDLEAYTEDTTLSDALLESFDLNKAFSNASWSFVGESDDETEEIFTTKDAGVISVASALTDDVNVDDIVTVNARVNIEYEDEYVISGFDTYDASGKLLASADVKRIGLTKIFGTYGDPVLFDGMDAALANSWVIWHQKDTTLGTQYDQFEITADGLLLSYEFDAEGQLSGYTTYEFVMPDGLGGYWFANENKEMVCAQVMYGADTVDGEDYGDLYFETYSSTGDVTGYNFAVSYYTLLFEMAAAEAGQLVEVIAPTDEEYEGFVGEIPGAVAGYRLYNGASLEDSTTYVIVTQFATLDAAVKTMTNDKELYNAYVLGGYAWGYFALTGYERDSDVEYFANIVAYLPSVFATPDYQLYGQPKEGQSYIDYLIAVMTSRGYSYVNKDTAAGTKYEAEVNELLAVFAEYEEESKTENAKDPTYPIAPHCEDVYVFYGEVDAGNGQVMEMYISVAVFAEPTEEGVYPANEFYRNSFGNVVLAGGYLLPMGPALNALMTYEYYSSLAA